MHMLNFEHHTLPDRSIDPPRLTLLDLPPRSTKKCEVCGEFNEGRRHLIVEEGSGSFHIPTPEEVSRLIETDSDHLNEKYICEDCWRNL